MNRKARYGLVLAAAAALFVGSVPVGASDSDDGIESSFKKSYVNRVYLKDDSVKAEAKNGVVTLTGTVAEGSHRVLAEETAASLAGVTRVDNRLSTKAEDAAENSDGWIHSKLKLALLFHRNVDGSKTDVSVKDGVVTLKGTASSAAQKELTTEYAKDIEGVKSVKNEMTVGESPAKTVGGSPAKTVQTNTGDIDDASITAQVKLTLFTHRSTSAVKTKVSTQNGKVTLSGNARNAAEKSLVTKLAEDVHGVSSVNNEMTVEGSKSK